MKRFLPLALLLLCAPAWAAEDADALELLLRKAAVSYDSVRDYEAIFRKTERKKDSNKMGSTENIFFKYEKPFKVFMGWMEGKKNGLQVLYERGKRDNALAVHVPGVLFRMTPVIHLDQSSPWVQEGGSTSYSIEDAGIGTFLRDFTAAVRRGIEEGKITVAMKGREANVTFPGTVKGGDYFAYRIIVRFDDNDLPVYLELYDWKDKLKGKYSYDELKLNPGPGGDLLKKRIHPALLPIYEGK